MKAVKTMMAAALLGMSSAAMAQATYLEANGDTTVFKKHAFLQLQGGAQYTLGEAKFSDLLSPNVQLGLGYQFNPWFGARVAVNAWQSKGGFNGKLSDGSIGNVVYKYKYVAPTVDFMFNLSQAFCGYNPHRVFNVTAFIGGGANIGFSNDEAQNVAASGYKMQYLWDGTKVRPMGKAGLALDFRLSDAVSLGIEGNANVLSDKYNSKKAGNADWYFNALAGVKIALGKTKKTRPYQEPAKPQPIVNNYVEPTPQPEVKKKEKEEIRRDIHFTIDSDVVNQVGKDKIKELADFLKKHADSQLTIEGYADKNTGTPAYNKGISERRAVAVFNILTKEYGIEAHRISYTFKGDVVQPFAANDDNRVAICVGTAAE